jgi:sugar/nucleoside kinase (ribokinase family)
MYDLISLGSVVKDIILVTDRGKIFKTPQDRLAPVWLGFELGEKIKVDELYQSLGGVAADVSIGLSKLGLKVLPYSTLGKDVDGQWLINELKKRRVKTQGLTLEKNRVTSFNILIVDKKSGERIIFSQKSSGDLNLASLPKFKTKYLFVSSLKGKIENQTEKILSYLEKNKTQLIVSPSTSQIRDDFKDLKKLLKVAKILILNRNEALEAAAKARSGAKNIHDLFKFLHQLGPQTISITDGKKGAWASNGEQIFYSPIQKVKTVDVTGAGDAFASGFLGFLLPSLSPFSKEKIKEGIMKIALKAGILNSASVVQHIGATKGLLSTAEIKKRMSRFSPTPSSQAPRNTKEKIYLI